MKGRQEKGRMHTNSNRGRRRQVRRNTCRRREFKKKGPESRKVTQKQRLKERWDHHNHMTYIYLTDLDEEAIVDFMKDNEELYDKTNEHFKDKVRKECLWEHFSNSHKLSVKVCKGIHLNHPGDTDSFKPSHPTHSAEPSASKTQQQLSRG